MKTLDETIELMESLNGTAYDIAYDSWLIADHAENNGDEDVEAEFEAMMDAAWAEHEMQTYASNSYDNDAIAYGEF